MSNILFFLLLSFCAANRVCINPSGKEVDWYSIFLIPASKYDEGIHYGYFDPTLQELQFHVYDVDTFPPTRITKYALESNSNFNYFFWNDDRTVKGGSHKSTPSTKAHAKGSLVYDSLYGAFLLHSLPRFPTRNSNNDILLELPSNRCSYGQTFLCISVNKTTAETIVKMLNCINVSVNKAVSSDRVNLTPNTWVQNLINNKMDSSCLMEHVTKIRSKSGVEFTFFGKNHKKKIIPYDTTIRETYKDHFYVRTWSRPSLAPALYDTYNLVNVLEVKCGDYSYGTNKEHSKWAIAKSKNIVCFGDVNHVESQKNRGGHIVCFFNANLHNIMKRFIVYTD